MSAVLDTGAKVTVLNSNIYYSIPQQHRPSLKPTKRKLVVAEAGMKMATHGMATMSVELGHKHFTWDMYIAQGFQSGPVPGTFTRLRSCIVPAEITEPPKLAVVKTTSTMVDRLVEYFS